MVLRPRMKFDVSEKTAYLLLYYLALIVLTFQLWFILSQAHAIKFFSAAADAALILLPYWLLSRHWRGTVFIPLLLVGPWLLVHIWYYRFLHNFPAISAIMLTSNFNADLLQSILGLYRWSDIMAILPSVCLFIFYYRKLRHKAENYRPSKSLRIIGIAISIAYYCGFHIDRTFSEMRHAKARGSIVHYTNFPEHLREHFVPNHCHSISDMSHRGVVIAIGQQIVDFREVLNQRRKLTYEETQAIENFIEQTDFPITLPDSLRLANSKKNIILIIVESLNASVISDSIAPTLTALLHEPGTISALNIEPQISVGGSGDGQLLANTGLMPQSTFSTAVALGSITEFPSLVRICNREKNTAIFADNTTTWNERATFTNYGFETIWCIDDFPHLEQSLGADLATITFADSIISTLPKPFFLELLTVSMHVPFNEPNIPDSIYARHLTHSNVLTQNYIRTVNYFDYSLSQLIKTLKKKDLYNNTLLFIVSDHTQYIADFGSNEQKMVFIAANTGLTESISRQALQSDIFPTMLQLIGIDNSTKWKGTGKSLFGIGQDEQWQASAKEISDLILRGDYFKGKIFKE